MPPHLTAVVEVARTLLDLSGVTVVVSGAVVATLTFFGRVVRDRSSAYTAYRRAVGQVVLAGLELLVAADIIGTVVMDPSAQGLGVLAAVVLVRTFLSFSLQVELDGRWPWQAPPGANQPEAPTAKGLT